MADRALARRCSVSASVRRCGPLAVFCTRGLIASVVALLVAI